MSRRITDDKVVVWFPVLKWGLAILFTVSVAILGFVQGTQNEANEIKRGLEIERNINIEQNKKIEETYRLMRDIASEQTRIAESMENISRNMILTMERVARDTSEIRMRVDRHIENSVR